MALRIFVTIPVTTTICEKSYGKLKIIINYLRSTICQSHLTGTAALSMKKDKLKTVTFDNVIDGFASKKLKRF